MHVVVIGLGVMGYGIASSLHRAGLDVCGFDMREEVEAKFAKLTGKAADRNTALAQADCVVTVVVNAQQTENALFGEDGVAAKLKKGAVIISCATIAPEQAIAFEKHANENGFLYLDAPISGGAARAAQGSLSVMASGSADAFDKADPVLDAMAEKIFRLGDKAGNGSAMKSVNQLLAGVHIAATIEAFAFGLSQGVSAEQLMEVIPHCAGTSWMFENRGPYIANGDYRPHSANDIFIKDLNIVQHAAQLSALDLPLTETALELFKETSEQGMGKQGDVAGLKLYADRAGLTLPPARYEEG